MVEIGREVTYSPAAVRALVRIDLVWSRRIHDKVRQLAADPDALRNQVMRLKGSPFSRLRVGDYRVVFDMDAQSVTVVAVGHRSMIYD